MCRHPVHQNRLLTRHKGVQWQKVWLHTHTLRKRCIPGDPDEGERDVLGQVHQVYLAKCTRTPRSSMTLERVSRHSML